MESGFVNVAIIGTGNVGGALGRSLSRAGHSVTFYSRDEQKNADVASASSSATADSAVHAVEGAEVVILAVPYSSVAGRRPRDRTRHSRQGRDRHDQSAQVRLLRPADHER